MVPFEVAEPLLDAPRGTEGTEGPLTMEPDDPADDEVIMDEREPADGV